ncbi:peptide/nickel transport system ATP-binding protein [Microbispora rosea]|uniref:Peptide/nickel transport system ATP-binding protein n=1 Tax=Microbispora rosea TaxID=58117 RepID=A0A1N6VXI5_9ACTN|nr:ABC transporter ATP-binding protein [Microbispora rosea]GIH51273.1 ABC transporter ATP-binding protein [Microbispora rosea subsp. rosea]SIQ82587.1 peptide/nickel transport system ATP-binding protein [Microbispora rosea]
MTLLAAEGVTLAYGTTAVVHDVSLAVDEGGVGLIGESGSGKTTLARALLGLMRPRSGVVRYGAGDLAGLGRAGRAEFRRAVQPVFQDGSEALDPRMTAGASIAEALTTHHRMSRTERADRIAALLADVGLDPGLAARRPHEMSGGQRQRVAIARALAVEPRLLVLDEPTSALDVTVQARILDLLERLAAEHGLGYLLITHNLGVVGRLCRTSSVMFAGRVVESGPTGELLTRPAHPYTRALRDAVPRLGGEPPRAAGRTEAAAAETGCPFRLRCPLAVDRCREETPQAREVEGRRVACHRAEEVLQTPAASAPRVPHGGETPDAPRQ